MTGPRLKLHRIFPHAALDREPRRDRRKCIGAALSGAESRDALSFLDDQARFSVTGELHVRVHHVVHGVQPGARLVGRFGRRGRTPVGSDRFLPCPDAREDVRRHVQRVGRRRRDLGIALCRRQALLGNRGVVVAVNEIVRHAGMLGVLHDLGLEDLGSFQGRRKGFVGRLLRGGQIDRVENLRLIIVGEALGHDLEGVGE